jgi:dTDP-glucose 4,6-dehydratase
LDTTARRLLVTGGAGFIGSNFVHYWRAAHPMDRIVVLDALTYAGDRRNLDDAGPDAAFRFVHGDITDAPLVDALLREEGIDTVVNFAAESHVDRSISSPATFMSTNIVGTHVLLESARRAWVDAGRRHRFHHVSTDEVFGSLAADAAPCDETAPYAPSSPYSASKAAADHLVCAYHRTYGLDVTISRCCNNHGPRQHPEKLVPKCIVSVLLGRDVPVYGDGRHVRDWLDVRDHCRALDLVIGRGIAGNSYNLAAGVGTANLFLVNLLCELVDRAFARDASLAARYPDAPPARGTPSSTLVRFVTDRPGHDRRYALSSAAARMLGFEVTRPLESSLATTVDWYLTHDSWWRPKLAG